MNKKMLKTDKSGVSQLRVWHSAGTKKQLPSYLIKCGDCDESVRIYYDKEVLEINGVLGTIKEWKEILLPLLKGE